MSGVPLVNLKGQVVAAVMLVVTGIGIGHVSAASQNVAGHVKPAAEPLVTTAARHVGVRRCLPAIAAVARRATSGATMQDLILDWDRQAPDAAPFFSLTGLGADDQRAALTIAGLPTAAGCALLVERISGSTQSCAAIASGELPGYPAGQLIPGIMVYQNPRAAGETYTLIANGTGCLIIRRQAALKWPSAQ